MCTDDTSILLSFFCLQKRIEKLDLRVCFTPYKLKENIFMPLKLKELSFGFNGYSIHHSALTKIISFQSKSLTSLDLSRSRIDDEAFLAICQLTKLKSLQIILNEVSTGAFQGISSLEKLEVLTLIKNNGDEHDWHLEILSKRMQRKLRKLEIQYPTTSIRGSVFCSLSDGARVMDHLSINCYLTASALFQITNKFVSLKTLNLHSSQKLIPTARQNTFQASCYYVNNNMQELSVKLDILDGWRFIESVVKKYPNLQKLELKSSMSSDMLLKLLHLILANLKKLRELVLLNEVSVVISPQKPDFINMLKFLGSKMSMISLNVRTADTYMTPESLFGMAFRSVKRRGDNLELFN